MVCHSFVHTFTTPIVDPIKVTSHPVSLLARPGRKKFKRKHPPRETWQEKLGKRDLAGETWQEKRGAKKKASQVGSS
jgi:hypothetical protein